MAVKKPGGGLNHFLTQTRAPYSCQAPMLRKVYCSHIANKAGDKRLCLFVADRAPAFYRDPSKLIEAISSGYFLTAVRETLSRLPNAQSFQESHFGEICSALFAEDVLGLKRLYSKLSLLTSENANAFKMDLLLVDPNSDPVEFYLGEVKSSMKTAAQGLPANHDRGCFADLFNSLRGYGDTDLDFDLAAAKDRLDELPEMLRARVKTALEPYAMRITRFAGFVMIDATTKSDSEVQLLATRKSSKDFDIDLIDVETLPDAVSHAYGHLSALKQTCSI